MTRYYDANAIFRAHPEVCQVSGNDAFDVEGNLVTLDQELVEAKEAEIAAEEAATQYQRDRQPEYPDLAVLADALYWSNQGDNTKLDEYYAACSAVKAKYPKP